MAFTDDASKLANFLDKNIYERLTGVSDVYEAANLHKQYWLSNEALSFVNDSECDNRQTKLEEILSENIFVSQGISLWNERCRKNDEYINFQWNNFSNLVDSYIVGLSQVLGCSDTSFYKKVIPIKQAVALLRKYYSDCDLEGLSIFNYMFKKDRIILFNNNDDFNSLALLGSNLKECFIMLNTLNQKYIYISKIIYLVHEVEHIKWYIKCCCNITEEEKFRITNFNGYSELNTHIVERKFIEYLIKNTEFSKEGRELLLDFYRTINSFCNCIKNQSSKNYNDLGPYIYASYFSDLLLEMNGYDYDVSLENSYNLLKQGSFPSFDIVLDKDRMTKVLRRQYEKIVE